jgi:hypothetical protein
MAVREGLRMQERDLFRDDISKPVPKCKKCTNLMLKNNDILVE